MSEASFGGLFCGEARVFDMRHAFCDMRGDISAFRLASPVACRPDLSLVARHRQPFPPSHSAASFPFAVSRYFCVGERGEFGCVISTRPSFKAGAR